MAIQVLILERNTLIREALTQMLYLCGCEAVPMQDANRTLGALAGVKFDFLIAGVAPGDESIPRLAYAARQLQPTLHIILGTAHLNETSSQRLVDAYVPFPVTVHELRRTIQQVLSKIF